MAKASRTQITAWIEPGGDQQGTAVDPVGEPTGQRRDTTSGRVAASSSPETAMPLAPADWRASARAVAARKSPQMEVPRAVTAIQTSDQRDPSDVKDILRK